jgi:hypothetical protein
MIIQACLQCDERKETCGIMIQYTNCVALPLLIGTPHHHVSIRTMHVESAERHPHGRGTSTSTDVGNEAIAQTPLLTPFYSKSRSRINTSTLHIGSSPPTFDPSLRWLYILGVHYRCSYGAVFSPQACLLISIYQILIPRLCSALVHIEFCPGMGSA